MPEQQQLDPQLVEQTRREIAKLVSEIEQIANQDIPEGEFYAEFMRRVSTALAAKSVALWMKTPQGNLQLQFQIALEQIGLNVNERVRQAHDELLRHVLNHPQPILINPHSGPGDTAADVQVQNPTSSLIVLAPVLLETQVIGLIEVFQDAKRRSAAQWGYVHFLARMAAEATKYFKNRQLRYVLNQQQLWDRLEGFIRLVHGGLNPKQVAYLIANEGRKFVECERVSVAIKRGRKATIEAVSGQDIVEKRSNLIRRMSKLATRVINHGENLIYSGTIEERWPRDVVVALESYLEESPSKLVAVIPMTDTREFGKRGRATTALVVEMIEDHAEPQEMGGRVEVIARHSGVALYNALEHHRIFMLPVWRALGSATQSIRGRNLPKVLLGVAAVVGITISMIFVPWPLRLEGRGELVPALRRNVYAPITGIVRDLRVDHADRTEVGTQLVEIASPELERERLQILGQLQAANADWQSQQRLQQQKGGRDAEIAGKMETLKRQIEGLQAQLQMLNTQFEQLRVESPIAGQVMDWKPKEKLLNRPVQQGDPLLEVADVDGKWILEVLLPENTITHITQAQADKKDGPLPVTFVISASPETTYHGTLMEISTEARPNEQENFVEAKIELDPEEAKRLPKVKGIEVRAKVNCGPRPLGYVLFRELIDFVREYVFF